MVRPRAAADFVVIRARVLELRREREKAVQGAVDQVRSKPYNRPIDRLPPNRDEEEFRPFRDRFAR